MGQPLGFYNQKNIKKLYMNKYIAKKFTRSNGFHASLNTKLNQRAFTKAEFLNVYEAKESIPGLLKRLEIRSLVIELNLSPNL
jgi:hypothetical protein